MCRCHVDPVWSHRTMDTSGCSTDTPSFLINESTRMVRAHNCNALKQTGFQQCKLFKVSAEHLNIWMNDQNTFCCWFSSSLCIKNTGYKFNIENLNIFSVYMLSRRHIAVILSVCLSVCEMCFHPQPFNTLFFLENICHKCT